MAVQVIRHEHTDDYPDAVSWHVDSERQLHVRGEKGNIAVYAVNMWSFARIH